MIPVKGSKTMYMLCICVAFSICCLQNLWQLSNTYAYKYVHTSRTHNDELVQVGKVSWIFCIDFQHTSYRDLNCPHEAKVDPSFALERFSRFLAAVQARTRLAEEPKVTSNKHATILDCSKQRGKQRNSCTHTLGYTTAITHVQLFWKLTFCQRTCACKLGLV